MFRINVPLSGDAVSAALELHERQGVHDQTVTAIAALMVNEGTPTTEEVFAVAKALPRIALALTKNGYLVAAVTEEFFNAGCPVPTNLDVDFFLPDGPSKARGLHFATTEDDLLVAVAMNRAGMKVGKTLDNGVKKLEALTTLSSGGVRQNLISAGRHASFSAHFSNPAQVINRLTAIAPANKAAE